MTIFLINRGIIGVTALCVVMIQLIFWSWIVTSLHYGWIVFMAALLVGETLGFAQREYGQGVKS